MKEILQKWKIYTNGKFNLFYSKLKINILIMKNSVRMKIIQVNKNIININNHRKDNNR